MTGMIKNNNPALAVLSAASEMIASGLDVKTATRKTYQSLHRDNMAHSLHTVAEGKTPGRYTANGEYTHEEVNDLAVASYKMRHCGCKSSEFEENMDLITGEARLTRQNTPRTTCQQKLCPECEFRRMTRQRADFSRACEILQDSYPKARFMMLTLTDKNPAIENTRAFITRLHQAFARLMKCKEANAVLGFVRRTEITTGEGKNGTSHPHMHVLLMVRPSYFGLDYVKAEQWAEAWARCLRVTEYTPVIDVSAAKYTDENGKKKIARERSQIWEAALEIFKYTTKSSELQADNDYLARLLLELKGIQLTGYGGVIADAMRLVKETKESYRIPAEEPLPDTFTPTGWWRAFKWNSHKGKEVRTPENDRYESGNDFVSSTVKQDECDWPEDDERTEKPLFKPMSAIETGEVIADITGRENRLDGIENPSPVERKKIDPEMCKEQNRLAYDVHGIGKAIEKRKAKLKK